MGLAPSDFTVFAGSLGDSRFLSPPRPLDDGYAPRLSPDGAWVAYLQRGQQPGATLFVKHLQTNETMPLSSAGPRPVYSTFPLDWAEQNIVWNRAGTELYFVDGADRSTLRRYPEWTGNFGLSYWIIGTYWLASRCFPFACSRAWFGSADLSSPAGPLPGGCGWVWRIWPLACARGSVFWRRPATSPWG